MILFPPTRSSSTFAVVTRWLAGWSTPRQLLVVVISSIIIITYHCSLTCPEMRPIELLIPVQVIIRLDGPTSVIGKSIKLSSFTFSASSVWFLNNCWHVQSHVENSQQAMEFCIARNWNLPLLLLLFTEIISHRADSKGNCTRPVKWWWQVGVTNRDDL